jgi:hypothetical protein
VETFGRVIILVIIYNTVKQNGTVGSRFPPSINFWFVFDRVSSM